MNADIGGNTSGFMNISFPGSIIPVSAACNIGKIKIMFYRMLAVVYPVFEVNQYRMKSELKDIIYFPVIFFFNFRKASIFQGFSTSGFSQMALAPDLSAKRI